MLYLYANILQSTFSMSYQKHYKVLLCMSYPWKKKMQTVYTKVQLGNQSPPMDLVKRRKMYLDIVRNKSV